MRTVLNIISALVLGLIVVACDHNKDKNASELQRMADECSLSLKTSQMDGYYVTTVHFDKKTCGFQQLYFQMDSAEKIQHNVSDMSSPEKIASSIAAVNTSEAQKIDYKVGIGVGGGRLSPAKFPAEGCSLDKDTFYNCIIHKNHFEISYSTEAYYRRNNGHYSVYQSEPRKVSTINSVIGAN